METLRETKAFLIQRSPRGARITAKETGATPHSRVVPLKEFTTYLRHLGEDSCNAACIWDYGVGVFKTQ